MDFDHQLVGKVRDELFGLHPEGVTDLFSFMAALYLGSDYFNNLTSNQREKDASKIMCLTKLLYTLQNEQREEKATA